MTLRNGSVVRRDVLDTVLKTLRRFAAEDPVALYELTANARQPDPWSPLQLFSRRVAAHLQALGLIDARGNVRADVRDIVLSAVEGDPLAMRVRSPIRGGD